MLRRKVIKEILAAIDASKFSRDDFELSDAQADSNSFSIRCIIDEKFYFTISSRGDNDTVMVERCPGTVRLNEIISIKGTAIAKFVSVWLTDAYEDILSSQGESTHFTVMKEALLRDIEASQENFGKEPFTTEEVEEFKQRLETLETTIEGLQEKLNFSETNIAGIREDISAMEEVLSKLPKSSWLKFSSNKIIQWFRQSVSSEEVGKAIGSAVKTMIS